MGAITKRPLLRGVMQFGAVQETNYRHREPDDPMLTAYVAGYFDGEGCITLCHDKRGYSVLRIAVVSLDRLSVHLVAYCLGGFVGIETRKWKGDSKSYYRWYASNRSAQQALLKMIPFLVGKRERAINACKLEFGKAGEKLSEAEHLRRSEFSKQGESWRETL